MVNNVAEHIRVSSGRNLADSLKGIAKLLLKSHRSDVRPEPRTSPCIILGNGPSLADAIAEYGDQLAAADTMAVNFAANTEEFRQLRPKYYILADPHFFDNPTDPNVARLLENLAAVDWPMTIFLPFEARRRCTLRPTANLSVKFYNALGVEGFRPLTDAAYASRRAMPRPRNVLIPAIMTAIGLGYKEIYIAGADHSWTRTLSVDDDNCVVSIQPHFYKEDDKELKRIRKEYLKHPLHSILYSFYLAFRSYFVIADFAARHGVAIYNSTPGSFIDAFPRRPLPF